MGCSPSKLQDGAGPVVHPVIKPPTELVKETTPATTTNRSCPEVSAHFGDTEEENEAACKVCRAWGVACAGCHEMLSHSMQALTGSAQQLDTYYELPFRFNLPFVVMRQGNASRRCGLQRTLRHVTCQKLTTPTISDVLAFSSCLRAL